MLVNRGRWMNLEEKMTKSFKAFHGFGAKFAYGGSILGSSKFTLLAVPADSKNDDQFKSGQN